MSRAKDHTKTMQKSAASKGNSGYDGPMNSHKAYAMGKDALEAQNAVVQNSPKSYFGNPKSK